MGYQGKTVREMIEGLGIGCRVLAERLGCYHNGRPVVGRSQINRWCRTGEVMRLDHALRLSRLLEPGEQEEDRLRRLEALDHMVPAEVVPRGERGAAAGHRVKP